MTHTYSLESCDAPGFDYSQKRPPTLTKAGKSLLLYLETCLVDKSGRVNAVHMNEDDRELIETWKETGYVEFGRILAGDATSDGSLWVRFSPAAWLDAHAERRARADRIQAKRRYRTTDDKRADKDNSTAKKP